MKFSVHVQGDRKKWSFDFEGDAKYWGEWLDDGLEVYQKLGETEIGKGVSDWNDADYWAELVVQIIGDNKCRPNSLLFGALSRAKIDKIHFATLWECAHSASCN